MSKFESLKYFAAPVRKPYQLLPFKFERLDEQKTVITNLAGEFHLLGDKELEGLVHHSIDVDSPLYADLRSKHFLSDEQTQQSATELLALKLRSRYHRIANFTGLHIFVVSLRCEHSCPYCQVSRQSQDKLTYDMSLETAERGLDLTFRSPSPAIKIEFQGGEPLLNFDLIREIVVRAKRRNETAKRDLQFVIATNLAVVTEPMLAFCQEHEIHISTSLDGPADLHNKNRPRPGHDSYEKAVRGIGLVRQQLGRDRVSALMTTMNASLPRVKDIIDEYIALDFPSIFLRPVSPYGFAVKTKSFAAYNAERWLEFYKEGLAYILTLNWNGIPFQESYASLILKKMFTSTDPGYVDLTSPAGIGIGAVVYNYDGKVFASDESRMLAEMGDDTFCLGDVHKNSYEEIFLNEKLLNALDDSFAMSIPMCSDCAFEPYCGADPVYHHGQYGDAVAHKAVSEFCHRNMSIFKHLISLMNADSRVKTLFYKWANS